jgi:hypothetical protein
MSEKTEQAGKPSPENYRMESLPGFDAVPRDMQDALERFKTMRRKSSIRFLLPWSRGHHDRLSITTRTTWG